MSRAKAARRGGQSRDGRAVTAAVAAGPQHGCGGAARLSRGRHTAVALTTLSVRHDWTRTEGGDTFAKLYSFQEEVRWRSAAEVDVGMQTGVGARVARRWSTRVCASSPPGCTSSTALRRGW